MLTAGIAAWFVRQISHDRQIESAVLVEAAELIDVRDRLQAIERALNRQTLSDGSAFCLGLTWVRAVNPRG